MKTRDRYLSGILLVLIGIIIGTLVAYYQQKSIPDDRANVSVTEVKHSAEPIFTDEQLTNIDDRFLFKNVAERVTPTVVYIETVVPFNRTDMPDDEFHNPEGGFWGNILPKRAQTVGSGILISSDGYILTNNHVIDGAINNQIEVVLNDKRTYEARIVGQDPTTDLAVIKIDAKQLPAITIGNSHRVSVGDWVLAIGNPFRLRSTVTAGIVSALSRDVQIINDRMRIESFIQTDAAINKGNSGGALVNTSGELIGVNTAIASQSGNYQGYGFAVPSNLAGKVAQDIIQYGEVRRALLGVSIVTVDAGVAESLDMDKIEGVLIQRVQSGDAADKAGLMAEDVILSVDETSINEANQLQQEIAVHHPGEIVELKIWRDGKILNKQVELGLLEPQTEPLAANQNTAPDSTEIGPKESEQDPGSDSEKRIVDFAKFEMGFRVIALSRPGDQTQYDLVITDIEGYSPAAKAGLQKGDRIQAVQNHPVEDLQSLKDLIAEFSRRRDTINFIIETREGTEKTIKVQQ